jgi:predicted dehydrogenase
MEVHMETTIALVGIGGYGSHYVHYLLADGPAHNARLVAGIDLYPERSRVLGHLQEAGIPIYADLEQFYKEANADLVIISTPIHLHAPLTCLALAHGSNVLCEKPLCALPPEADQMAEAEKRSGKFVAIGYQWSFSDAIQALKQDVMAGLFGRPIQLKTLVLWPRPVSYYERNSWAGRIKTPDGQWVFDSPVNNAMAHYLHNMLYILGNSRETSAWPAAVQAELWRANQIENYDTAALRVTTKQEAELLMFVAHPVQTYIGPLARFQFEHAVIECGDDRVFVAHFDDGREKVYGDPEATIDNKIWQSASAVHSGEPVACGIEASLPHIVCVQEAQKYSVASFPEKTVRVEEQNEDQLVWVHGLSETLQRCYQAGRLPSE